MNAKPKVIATPARIPGHYDSDAVSLATGLLCEDPSLAIQSQAAETDINVIVERYGLTGEIPVSARVPFPVEVDCDEILDYRSAWDRILQARESFGSLPAGIRARFQNDPMAFADYATDPKNLPELRELGLAPPAPPSPQAGPPAV